MKMQSYIVLSIALANLAAGVADAQVANASAGVQSNQNDRLPPQNAPAWSNAEANLNTMAPSAGNGTPPAAAAPNITGQINPGIGAYGGTLGGTPPAAPALNPDATFNAHQ